MDNSVHLAAPLGIALGGISVFVVIIVGIAILRRRAGIGMQASRNITEIDHAASANAVLSSQLTSPPQMNGYENPTYQYYIATAKAWRVVGRLCLTTTCVYTFK